MTETDRAGRTKLHYASLAGDTEAVRALLAAGEDPQLGDSQGMTPLHFAAEGRHADVAGLLLDAGAAADAEDKHGNTALFKAVFGSRGDGSVIALLRARGANPHHPNRHGVSPVQLARQIANYDIARHFADISET